MGNCRTLYVFSTRLGHPRIKSICSKEIMSTEIKMTWRSSLFFLPTSLGTPDLLPCSEETMSAGSSIRYTVSRIAARELLRKTD